MLEERGIAFRFVRGRGHAPCWRLTDMHNYLYYYCHKFNCKHELQPDYIKLISIRSKVFGGLKLIFFMPTKMQQCFVIVSS